MSGLGRKFVNGTIWMSASQLVTYSLSFGGNIVLARLLAPDDFGVFALALSILAIFYILGSWSFSMAVIQAMEIDQKFFDTAYMLSLALGCALFALIAVASLFLKRFYSTRVVQILVILSALQVPALLSSCYSATLQRELEYREVSLVQIGARITSMVVAIVLAGLGFGVWSLVCKEALFAIGNFCGMWFISPWRFKWHFDPAAARHLFDFGSRMFVSRGLESFLSNFQGFIVGTVLGTTALGYFDRAIKLSQLGNTVAGPAVNQVSLVAYSRLQTSDDRLSRAFEVINYFLMRIFVLLAIMFFLFGENITVLLYGEKWHTAGNIVPLLFVYVVSLTIFGNVKHLLYSQGRVGEVVKVRAVQSGLLVLGMLVALQRYELVGAALVLDLLYLVGTALAFVYVKSCVNISLRQGLLAPVLAGLVAVVLFRVFQLFGQWIGGSAPMLVMAVSVALVYLGVLWLLERKRLQRDVRYFLEVIGVRT